MPAKVHYRPDGAGHQSPRCGSRAKSFTSTWVLEDVTCGNCRKSLMGVSATNDQRWRRWLENQAKRDQPAKPTKLHCNPKPCDTCPYVRATPPGIWDPEEYEKLRRFDADGAAALGAGVFACHLSKTTEHDTVCRGWLGTHYASMAVRLACAFGKLDVEDVPDGPDPTLYSSGNEAADAGLAGVQKPSAEARKKIGRLVRRGAGRPR